MASSRSSASASRPTYRCSECGWTSPKWVGRCGECQTWGSVDVPGGPVRGVTAGPVSAPARPIVDVPVTEAVARPTGIGELDRVLGGGIVAGSVVLLAGEPGIGKSTLLLDVAARAARDGVPTLYVTGEESAAQVRLRADRISAVNSRLWLAAETDLAAVVTQVDTVQPGLLVIDSVQTIANSDVEGAPGGITQVREVASALIRIAKERGIATVLVGHVTKDGGVAGPRLLEHLVDVVVTFDGDQHQQLRVVRATKNRFGPTDEVGCFELGETGLVALPDPSGLFLTRRTEPVPGTCVTVTLEGRRPLVAEIQALVSPTSPGNGRRTTSGLDNARAAMIVAVLSRRCGLPLQDCEVFAASVGGITLREPASDLALALAITSGIADEPLPLDLVALGEVGLAGEIRPVTGIERRLTEAARFGYSRAIVPPGTGRLPDGIRAVEVADIYGVLDIVRRTQEVDLRSADRSRQQRQ